MPTASSNLMEQLRWTRKPVGILRIGIGRYRTEHAESRSHAMRPRIEQETIVFHMPAHAGRSPVAGSSGVLEHPVHF